MYTDDDALYRLLPAHIRSRDLQNGRALQEFLAIVGEQAAALQQDFRRMYDGCFIETCDEWLVPYIADLFGFQPAPLPLQDLAPDRALRVRQALSGRRDTANAIANRRRKGTVWILEEMAQDVAHWPARAVEFHCLLAVAQHVNHLRPDRPATADLRDAARLERVGGPFDTLPRIVDVRRIGSTDSPGRHHPTNVGLFVFRTRRYPVTDTPAFCVEEVNPCCFAFSVLGNDTPLYRLPEPERDRFHLAHAGNLPLPISLSELGDPALYGPGRSLSIRAPHWPKRLRGGTSADVGPIAADKIIPADLATWKAVVPRDHVAVDPVRGRIMFPAGQAPRGGVFVSYGHGFAMDLGGGEYERPAPPLPDGVLRLVVDPAAADGPAAANPFGSIAAAFRHWRERRDAPQPPEGGPPRPGPALLIELSSSGVYPGRFRFDLLAGESVHVMAAPRSRPVLRVADDAVGGSDAIEVRGLAGSRIVFDGVLITGRGVEIGAGQPEGDAEPAPRDDPCEVVFRHSTLVPGWGLLSDCRPRRATDPSILVDNVHTRVRIESSMVGAIQIVGRSDREPTALCIVDSVVDATAVDRQAIGGAGAGLAWAALTVLRSTIVGQVAVHALPLAENSIFSSTLTVARRQVGCMRYSYVMPGSRTPRRHRCQPDAALTARELDRVLPRFVSMRYGTPDYLRLADCTPAEIARGADDESEMGVYHDLFEPKRLAALQARLDDFVPAAFNAAVVLAT